MAKAFVKYVGGKRLMQADLMALLPGSFRSYYEPMVGGGSLFWALASRGALDHHQVVLGDTDLGLMRAYYDVRWNLEAVLDELGIYDRLYKKAPEKLYYRIREEWNASERSTGRYIFLKQTSFNGLWRYNRKGRLNMSWGKYKDPVILDAANLAACSKLLNDLDVRCFAQDYKATLRECAERDFVYLDPPYLDCFELYSPDGFGVLEHENLVRECARLAHEGVHIVYTNQNQPLVREWLRELWPTAKIKRVKSRRFINCDGRGRMPVVDLLVNSAGLALREEAAAAL